MLPCSFYAATINFDLGVSLAVGYGMGRYLNGDADQVGVSFAEGRTMNELPVIGNFIFGWMSVYGAFTRKLHRSFFTHSPGVATAGRLFWLFFWIPLIYHYWQIDFKWWDLMVATGVWLGLSASDMMHFLADLWFSKSSKHLAISKEK
jgi:hypothetical protein